MYLSEVSIYGYRVFSEELTIKLNEGLNVIVGENGCGKSAVIDSIRMLLNEDEYSRCGIYDEDFHMSLDGKIKSNQIRIRGKFSNLSDEKKTEYLTWLDSEYNAVLNISVENKLDKRNNFKKKIWGGESSSSIFEWEPLNDIQCVYLPPLRDAEKKLRASRGSRLARLLLNLSRDELNDTRKNGQLMEIEQQVKEFNNKLAESKYIDKAGNLINNSLVESLGNIFSQKTKIQFNDVTFERVVESLKLVFFPKMDIDSADSFRNLFQNSLGYNNLIYLATVLAEFEGLKENYSSPRILLIEELEAHLHPQLQVKLLNYLENQSKRNEIQIIVTTHSPTIVASTSIENIISMNILENNKIHAIQLKSCGIEKKAKNFINRWLDTTKSVLLFSKGVILVEGLAEALIIPKLASIYLKKYKMKNPDKDVPRSLEEMGVSVINMNGIFFDYFMQLYRGYKINIPDREESETKKDYEKKINNLIKKTYLEKHEYSNTEYIPIRCVAITDNDPISDSKPKEGDIIEGMNPKLYLVEQLKNMTNNCRVFTNLKTFEYDLGLNKNNLEVMIDVLLKNIDTDGPIKSSLTKYKEELSKNDDINNLNEISYYVLNQIDSNKIGKGMFAQVLLEKIDELDEFIIPQYIEDAFNFVLNLD
ncbi:ATP-dependent nuclease [Clostridium perfringens]|uniref:ATP-dependent nuclease n=2 Tax=Clostridium perfringens TaxID=1502 RepID=UPI001A32F4A5|nr:AAA family ATPase [Clostridium perfringens]MDK0983935.1 AAA family ATPase [Clostridium perfringens]MDM0923991.1 AAA family ATPase [Clostridium perfringens]MDU2436083.1 AAA family ATPase [Clostridium perfringens]MDU2516730.1 AAA family ATPase [Clostridium perfringens]